MTLPNILTLARLALIVPILVLLSLDYNLTAFGLYIICAATDYIDGMVARKYNQITPFGTFLDPIVDKILVASILIALVGNGSLTGLWIAPVILILAREILISGLREFLGPYNIQMPVTRLAKWKTATQMIALGLLIIGPPMPPALIAGQALLAAAALITVITGWGYMKAGLEHIRKMT